MSVSYDALAAARLAGLDLRSRLGSRAGAEIEHIPAQTRKGGVQQHAGVGARREHPWRGDEPQIAEPGQHGRSDDVPAAHRSSR